MNEDKRKKLGELQFAKQRLNEKQQRLRKLINKNIKTDKYSYAEIKEVLYLIDREQQYLSNHRR